MPQKKVGFVLSICCTCPPGPSPSSSERPGHHSLYLQRASTMEHHSCRTDKGITCIGSCMHRQQAEAGSRQRQAIYLMWVTMLQCPAYWTKTAHDNEAICLRLGMTMRQFASWHCSMHWLWTYPLNALPLDIQVLIIHTRHPHLKLLVQGRGSRLLVPSHCSIHPGT